MAENSRRLVDIKRVSLVLELAGARLEVSRET
jgi:hypothetical protein